jgi:hypothetical protein
VPQEKLLTRNPWNEFTWIPKPKAKPRRFDRQQLLDLSRYFESNWEGVTAAGLILRLFVWTWARRSEVVSINRRICEGLTAEVAEAFGHQASGTEDLERQLREAVAAKDWDRAKRLSGQLARQGRQAGSPGSDDPRSQGESRPLPLGPSRGSGALQPPMAATCEPQRPAPRQVPL